MVTKFKLGVVVAAIATLVGCQSTPSEEEVSAPEVSSFDLKILHINDHHSHLTPGNADLILGGEKTRVKIGGFPQVVSLFDDLSESSESPVLKLHAGDAITGDLYYTLFKGEADAALMNEVCFDAFALGNHEFDDGDAGLVQFLDWLAEGDCNTAVLAANIKPEVGVSPLAKTSEDDYFVPYIIKKFDEESVAIIGIDIAKKTKMSSSPDETTAFLDEAETAQKYINKVSKMGVDKIILLTHYQYENDLKLASKLKGVDVIVGGDSHTLIGDFSNLGLNTEGAYPTQVTDANGDLVCVVQAWQYSAVVGELNVTWDQDGKVTSCGGTPHLILADSFKRKNSEGKRVELEGEARSAVLAQVESTSELSIVKPDEAALSVLDQFSGQVDSLKSDVIGKANVDLCLERIPGQGKSKLCSASITKSLGSDITNIVAKAFRDMSKTSDIAIQNGGGVRVDIAAGEITIGDAYTLLPFANTLVELSMSGAEIKQVLEEAYDYATQEGGSTGAYPYASGLRWKIDADKAMGDRFFDLEVMTKSDTSWQPIDLSKTYTVVTNNYIAGGKDGYLTFGSITKEGRVVDTYLDYAQSFVDYVKKVGALNKLPSSEYSTQEYLVGGAAQ